MAKVDTEPYGKLKRIWTDNKVGTSMSVTLGLCSWNYDKPGLCSMLHKSMSPHNMKKQENISE